MNCLKGSESISMEIMSGGTSVFLLDFKFQMYKTRLQECLVFCTLDQLE